MHNNISTKELAGSIKKVLGGTYKGVSTCPSNLNMSKEEVDKAERCLTARTDGHL